MGKGIKDTGTSLDRRARQKANDEMKERKGLEYAIAQAKKMIATSEARLAQLGKE